MRMIAVEMSDDAKASCVNYFYCGSAGKCKS